MTDKTRFSATVRYKDTTVFKLDDLEDIRTNDGFVIFVKQAGMYGMIYKPRSGDMIDVAPYNGDTNADKDNPQ